MRPSEIVNEYEAITAMLDLPNLSGSASERVAQILKENEVLKKSFDFVATKRLDSELKLRTLLAQAYTGHAHLYTDDGELQDQTEIPVIDFKRDSAEAIQLAFVKRALNETKRIANEQPPEEVILQDYKRDLEKAIRSIKLASEFIPELRQALSPASAISHMAFLLTQDRYRLEKALIKEKPKLYATFDENASGVITLSVYPSDSDEFETNHIELVELRNGRPNIHSSVMNILRNVLYQANIQLEIE